MTDQILVTMYVSSHHSLKKEKILHIVLFLIRIILYF